MENNKIIIRNGHGIGFTLGIIFIILKVCNVIDWAWIWVLAPIWIPVSLALIALSIGFIFILIGLIVNFVRGY